MKLSELTFARVAFLGLALAFTATAETALPSTRLSVGMRLYGTGAESRETQSQLAGTELEAGLAHAFSPQVSLDVAAGLLAETGSSRALFVDEFRPRQQLRLREGSVVWKPLSSVEVRAGSVDQDRWAQPLLLAGQSFPSVVESATNRVSNWIFSLSAEQAIATDSTSLIGGEKFPKGPAHFYFERASVAYDVRERFHASVHASHFLFDGLSAASAYPSRFSGNSVNGTGPANSAFAQGFQGFEVGGSIGAYLTAKIEPMLSASWVRNAEASSGNQAARAVALVNWRVGEMRIKPSVEVFRLEADATPASFNDRALGHANRQGYGLGIGVNFVDAGIETAARFVDAKAIVPSAYQSDLKWFQLSLRTRYDVL